MRTLFLAAAVALSTTLTFAQPNFGKKDIVIPKFDVSLAKFEDFKAWQGRMQYGANISRDGNSVVISHDRDWASRGLPELIEYTIREINLKKGKPSEVYLVSTVDLPAVGTKYEAYRFPKQIKLTIAPDLDPQATLDAILFKGSSADFLKSDYVAGVLERFLPSKFVGPLSSIPPPAQRKLMIWAELKPELIASETLRDKAYLSVDMSQTVAYNTIQVNQAERAARQAEYAIKKLKEVFEIVGRPDGIEGIVATAKIVSYDFVRKDDRNLEKFEMYVPFDLLTRFSNLDITNQDLVDGSILLLDGSRIKVNLSAF